MTMITFREGNARFTCRAAGVAMDGQRVLLHRSERDDFWALPGGRVELMETAADALRREMIEEIGVAVSIERLLWVTENFFEHNEQSHHEIGLYFKIGLPADSPLRAAQVFYGLEGPLRLVYQWFPIAGLAVVPLYPSFLRQALRDLPATPQHVVHVDQ